MYERDNDIFYGITDSSEVAASVNLDEYGFVIITKSKEGREMRYFSEQDLAQDYSAFIRWYHEFKLPLVITSRQNMKDAVETRQFNMVHVLYIKKSDTDYNSTISKFTDTARRFHGRFKILFFIRHLDESRDNTYIPKRIRFLINYSPTTTPSSVIYKERNSHYVMFKLIGNSSFEEFTTSVLRGNVPRYYQSQDLPKDWDAKPVKVLVQSNFHEVVFNKTNNVLVFFIETYYFDEPALDELAEQFKSTVVIARMDTDKNEVSYFLAGKVQEHVECIFFPILDLRIYACAHTKNHWMARVETIARKFAPL